MAKRRRLDKRTLIFLGAALGAETLACGGLVFSIHGKKDAMEAKLASRTEQLELVREVSAQLPTYQAEYRNTLARLRFLEAALPTEEYIPTLLGQIERTAISSKVTIKGFKPKPVQETPKAATTAEGEQAAVEETPAAIQREFEMNIEGSYANIQGFLSNLTRFRKILALKSLNVRPQGDSQKGVSPKLNATLVFTAFMLAPEEPVAEAAPVDRTATASAGTAGGGQG